MDLSAIQKRFLSTTEIIASIDEVSVLPFRRLPQTEVKPFINSIPLYDLKVAAGRFSDEQQVTEWLNGQGYENISDIDWIELPDAFRHRQGFFVAQVVGESMNRRIPNGAWCLFMLNPEGTRQGKVVFAQHRDITDIDSGGQQYTVKVYSSTKEVFPDGTWQHTSITLRPDTTAPGYEPIIFTKEKAEDVKVIAELVAVLG